MNNHAIFMHLLSINFLYFINNNHQSFIQQSKHIYFHALVQKQYINIWNYIAVVILLKINKQKRSI
jgi:hypothetical protein